MHGRYVSRSELADAYGSGSGSSSLAQPPTRKKRRNHSSKPNMSVSPSELLETLFSGDGGISSSSSTGPPRAEKRACAEPERSPQTDVTVSHSVSHVALVEETYRTHIETLEGTVWLHIGRLAACGLKGLMVISSIASSATAANAAKKKNVHASRSEADEYKAIVEAPVDRRELDDMVDKKRRLEQEVKLARSAQEKLRAELEARAEYNDSIAAEAARQSHDITVEFRAKRKEAHDAARSRIAEAAKVRQRETEAHRMAAVQEQRDTLQYVKQHGNYKWHIDFATETRQRSKQTAEETEHLRRGYKQRASMPQPTAAGAPPSGNSEGGSGSAMSPEQKVQQQQAEVDMLVVNTKRRQEQLSSRVTSLEKAAALQNKAVADANAIRTARQQQREAETAAAHVDLQRFNQTRTTAYRQHASGMVRERVERDQSIAVAYAHMGERIELVQQLQAEHVAFDRSLGDEMKDEVRAQQVRIKNEQAAQIEAQQKLEAGDFAERAKEQQQLKEELHRLCAEHHLQEQTIQRECKALEHEQQTLEREKALLVRQNEVLGERIAKEGGREVQLVTDATVDLRTLHTVGGRSQSTPLSNHKLTWRVADTIYTSQRSDESHQKSVTPEPKASHESPEAMRAQSTQPLELKVKRQPYDRKPTLPDPVERRSLAYPTRSAVRHLKRNGESGVGLIRHANRILELESELRAANPFTRGTSSQRNPEALKRLTERSIEHDMRTVLFEHDVTPSLSGKAPGASVAPAVPNIRLYNPAKAPLEDPAPLAKFVTTGKSLEQLVDRFYTDAVASHTSALDSATNLVTRLSGMGKHPSYPLPHLINVSERLLFSPIRNQRHVPPDTKGPKMAMGNGEFASRFFSQGVEQQREWSKELAEKYNLPAPQGDPQLDQT